MSTQKTPLDRHNENRDEFHRAIGQAITEWSEIEHELENLFSAIVGDIGLGRAILRTVLGFSVKFQIINSAMCQKLGSQQDALSHWNSLSEYIRELSGDRNYIAHTTLLEHGLKKSDWVDGLGVKIMIDPGQNESPLHEQRILPMGVSEVQDLILDFKHCRQLIGNLWSAMATNALCREFCEPVSRLRETRGLRQAENRKLYQAQHSLHVRRGRSASQKNK